MTRLPRQTLRPAVRRLPRSNHSPTQAVAPLVRTARGGPTAHDADTSEPLPPSRPYDGAAPAPFRPCLPRPSVLNCLWQHAALCAEFGPARINAALGQNFPVPPAAAIAAVRTSGALARDTGGFFWLYEASPPSPLPALNYHWGAWPARPGLPCAGNPVAYNLRLVPVDGTGAGAGGGGGEWCGRERRTLMPRRRRALRILGQGSLPAGTGRAGPASRLRGPHMRIGR